MDILKLADLEITQGNLWKPWAVPPVAVVGQTIKDFKAVQIVPAAHEAVEQKELDDHVDNVKHLDKQIQPCQEGTIAFGADKAHDLLRLLAHAHERVEAVVSVRLQPAVHVLGDVAHRLLALAGVADL